MLRRAIGCLLASLLGGCTFTFGVDVSSNLVLPSDPQWSVPEKAGADLEEPITGVYLSELVPEECARRRWVWWDPIPKCLLLYRFLGNGKLAFMTLYLDTGVADRKEYERDLREYWSLRDPAGVDIFPFAVDQRWHPGRYRVDGDSITIERFDIGVESWSSGGKGAYYIKELGTWGPKGFTILSTHERHRNECYNKPEASIRREAYRVLAPKLLPMIPSW
jgi:hypothetical protein